MLSKSVEGRGDEAKGEEVGLAGEGVSKMESWLKQIKQMQS